MARLHPFEDLVEQSLVVVKLAVHFNAHRHARPSDFRVIIVERLSPISKTLNNGKQHCIP